jgi:cytochrome c oxidase subunit IV
MAEHASAAHAEHGHDEHEAEHIKAHIKVYLLIFAMLILGTILTVAISYIDFGEHWKNIAIGLAIASIKATLVAGWFMHLISEKKLIYSVMAVTVFFFIALCFITIWSMTGSSLIGGGMNQHSTTGGAAHAAVVAPAHH